MIRTTQLASTAALLSLAMSVIPAMAIAGDKAPMPQTKGMQGMDPKVHDQPATDPYKDCKQNPEKVAQQAKHPMPQTKGMQGMDPKAHTMDCPEPKITKPDPDKAPTHVHKAPGG